MSSLRTRQRNLLLVAKTASGTIRCRFARFDNAGRQWLAPGIVTNSHLT